MPECIVCLFFRRRGECASQVVKVSIVPPRGTQAGRILFALPVKVLPVEVLPRPSPKLFAVVGLCLGQQVPDAVVYTRTLAGGLGQASFTFFSRAHRFCPGSDRRLYLVKLFNDAVGELRDRHGGIITPGTGSSAEARMAAGNSLDVSAVGIDVLLDSCDTSTLVTGCLGNDTRDFNTGKQHNNRIWHQRFGQTVLPEPCRPCSGRGVDGCVLLIPPAHGGVESLLLALGICGDLIQHCHALCTVLVPLVILYKGHLDCIQLVVPREPTSLEVECERLQRGHERRRASSVSLRSPRPSGRVDDSVRA